MTKTILILSTVLVLGGCGWFDRQVASVVGGATKTCMSGVLYYQFTSGAAVAYNPDGTVKTCK